MMISIQNSHSVSCDGYHQPQIRTGYESLMPYRVGKMYAYMAEQDGKVIEITEHIITIEYKDKQLISIPIGRRYGRAEGSMYPHDIATPLKQGQSFKKDDVISYNTGFFEPDFMNPKQIIMKISMKAKVAIMETTQTLEDSDTISPKLSSKLSSKVVKEKTFVVNFNQSLRNVIPPGTAIKPSDVIFIIEDAITSGIDVFDSDTIESLSRLSNLAPKAKVNGILDRYEIYYNGDIEDMTPSLRKLTNYSNKMLSERSKGTEHHIKDGRVNEEFRVEGKALQVDTLVIKTYIVINDKGQLGDKVVFANQLKSVISEVMSYDMKTERGEPIDAIFSYMSIGKRITLSPLLIGTSSVLLEQVAKKAVAVYRS